MSGIDRAKHDGINCIRIFPTHFDLQKLTVHVTSFPLCGWRLHRGGEKRMLVAFGFLHPMPQHEARHAGCDGLDTFCNHDCA
jgi:hypothetical protein